MNTIAEKLKRQSKDDFRGRDFEAWLIVQSVAWYLSYSFSNRGFEVDHSTVIRWVLAYASVIEKRLPQFRRTIARFEAMLWLRKGFAFSGGRTVNDHDDLLARLFGP